MNIFYEHLSDDERGMLVLENAFDLKVRKIGAAVDAVCEATAINMKEAENKVIMESGTIEDLEVLFEAAAGEGAEKSKGLIGKLIETIVNFLREVKNKIKGIFTKEKAEELKGEKEVKDTGILDTVNGKLGGIMSSAKGMIAKITHGGKVSEDDIAGLSAKAKKVGVIAAAATGATVGGKILYSKIMKGYKEIDDAENAADALQAIYASCKDGKEDGSIKTILNVVSTAAKGASKAVMTAIKSSKIGVAVSSKAEEVKTDKATKQVVKTNESKYSSSANSDAKDMFDESASDDFDSLLEQYSYETEESTDGTKAGSFDDLEKALSIF